MTTNPTPICIPCKQDLGSKGYDVVILKGKLFHKMSCIYCGAPTSCLGTIEKVNAGKAVLATV